MPQTVTVSPRPVTPQVYFVEILRHCWRRRYDRTFINRLPHFSARFYLLLQHDPSLKKSFDPAIKQSPLAFVDKRRSGHEYFKLANENSLKRIIKSSLNLTELKTALAMPRKNEYLMDTNNFNVAHVACIRNNVEVLKVFLDHFPIAIKIYTKVAYQTPLHFAVIHNSVQCCKLLLQKGADIYFRDFEGNSALDLAISIGNPEILNLFVTKTDLLARPPSQYACFRQAASVALEWGLLEQASIFAYLGAIADLHDPLTGMNLLHLSCMVGNQYASKLKEIIPFERDNCGMYPTHIAILSGHYEMLPIFSKAELQRPCPFGMNLLEFAAHHGAYAALPIITDLLPELSFHEAVLSMIKLDSAIGLKAILSFGFRMDQLYRYLVDALLFNRSFRCAEVLITMAPRAVYEIKISGMSLAENAIVRGDVRVFELLANLGVYANFKMETGPSPL